MVWNNIFIFPDQLGMPSSQLTSSYVSEGWLNHQPAMFNSYVLHHQRVISSFFHHFPIGFIWFSLFSTTKLVGGLEHFLFFPYTGKNHPNWLIFFRGVAQPPTRKVWKKNSTRSASVGCGASALVGRVQCAAGALATQLGGGRRRPRWSVEFPMFFPISWWFNRGEWMLMVVNGR